MHTSNHMHNMLLGPLIRVLIKRVIAYVTQTENKLWCRFVWRGCGVWEIEDRLGKDLGEGRRQKLIPVVNSLLAVHFVIYWILEILHCA